MTLRGAVHHFPLETVLLLLSETGKTGRLEVRGDEGRGFLALSGGRLVSAELEDEQGPLALGAIFTILRGDFEFLPAESIDREDLAGDLDALLDGAVVERDRIAAVREVIPNDRIRFRMSGRAAASDRIVLSSEQWRALVAADGERDLGQIAEQLGMTRIRAEDLLASLVRAGMLDTVEPSSEAPDRPSRRLPSMPPIPPTTEGEPVVLRGTVADFPLETIVQLLAATKKTGRLEVRAGEASSVLGLAEGRLRSATAGEEDGEIALGSAFTAQHGEFDFVPMAEAPAASLSGDLDELLDRAAALRDQLVAVRTLIPSARSRFRLSDRATRKGEITLTPEQWRVLLVVDPQRDVAMIAEELRMRKLPTSMLLAELIRGGFLDVVPAEAEPVADERLSALSGLLAPAEPGPPPAAPKPPAEPAPAAAEIDPRLAAFGAWGMPAGVAPPKAPPPEPQAPPGSEPLAESLTAAAQISLAPAAAGEAPAPEARAAPARGGLFGLLGAMAAAAPVAAPARPRSAQLAAFANELVAAYNSGRYGKARVEDRMPRLLMRVDEQADPIDRPVPLVEDRVDVAQIERGSLEEVQAVPYLALLVRQIYDDAERAFGKDKARRGFRDTRDWLFGKDLALFGSPEIARRLPKV